MSYRGRYDSSGTELADRLPLGVRSLILANGIIFLIQQIVRGLEPTFGLVPDRVFAAGQIWQLVTYMFLHGGLFHLLFNMLALFMFGSEIERTWGTREFVKYYFFTGVGAGLTHWAVSMNSSIPTIGASGAIFGILLAFGMLFPNRPILLYFILPIPAKYLVILFGFIEVVAVAGGGRGDGIARFAHLGGLLFGFLYMKSERLTYPLRRWYGGRRRKLKLATEAIQDKRRQTEREEIDAILDKISREGMGSLTRQEKKTLEEAGRRGRNVRER